MRKIDATFYTTALIKFAALIDRYLVVKFTLFVEAFDYAFIIRYDLRSILGKHIPLQMLTNSKSLFDFITNSSITTECRLMIDIKAVCEAYKSMLISDVGLLRSHKYPADAFTELGH